MSPSPPPRPRRSAAWFLLIPLGALVAALPTACVVLDDYGYGGYGGGGYGPVTSGIYRPSSRSYGAYRPSYGGYGRPLGYGYGEECEDSRRDVAREAARYAEEKQEQSREWARERSRTPTRYSSEVSSEQRRLRDNESGWERKKKENRERGRM